METHTPGTVNFSLFESFVSQAAYVLGLCLVVCFVLLLRRSNSHPAPSDVETAFSKPTLHDPGVLKHDIDPANCNVTSQQAHLTKSLGPFSGLSCMVSVPTSGYLAARADVGAADELQYGQKHRELDDMPHSQSMEMDTSREPQQPQRLGRRASYPPSEDQRGGLCSRSKHDETEYIPDCQDAEVIWRRRTMMFLERL